MMDALRKHPLSGGGYLGKYVLVTAYHQMVRGGELQPDAGLLERLRMKPVRTLSGVTTVTVLTKPYPCPGKCIFCPTDVRMPKSYLPDEPGAMRGLEHDFDPYAQVKSRMTALANLGHPTDKIELLILGGTWTSYKRGYQEWFVKRCFDAMNEISATQEQSSEATGAAAIELKRSQALNEHANHRNVGLVIETRPDEITPEELRWLRHLGVTKVQMGAREPRRPRARHEQPRTRRRVHAPRHGAAAGGRFQNCSALDAKPARCHTGFRPAGFWTTLEGAVSGRDKDLSEPTPGECRTL